MGSYISKQEVSLGGRGCDNKSTPIYDAMCVRMVEVREIADLFEYAKLPKSGFYTDGVHLNADGIVALSPHLKMLAKKYNLDLILGDSCLCAVFKTILTQRGIKVKDADYSGDRVLQPLLDIPVRPAWGKGFCKSAFWYHSWEHFAADTKTIGIVCTGNDVAKWNTAEDVEWHMDRLQDWYSEQGIYIIDRDISINKK